MEKQYLKLKICLTGLQNVGKTSLLIRLCDNTYQDPQPLVSIGFDFKIKKYLIGEIQAKAFLWDPSGSQRYKAITTNYYRNSHAILFVFDLSDKQSFISLHRFETQVKELQYQSCKFYLIGCKSDKQHQVTTEEILQFCEKYNMTYFQTSAKQNYGVQQCFSVIVSEAGHRVLQLPSSSAFVKAKSGSTNSSKKYYCF